MFKLAKTSAIKARTQAINQLKAVLVTADPALRESLAGLSRWMLIRRCAQLDTTDPQNAVAAAIYTLRLLGQRILRLGEEIRDLEQHITTAINACAPALLQRRGIGQDSAAALLLAAGDNPERLDTEASFAALCGTSPLEASSGKHPATQTQPRRRPASQRRALPHRAHPPAMRPAHPAIPATTPGRGQDPPRGDPLPQTLRRPRGLPTPTTGLDQPRTADSHHLTQIGASNTAGTG